MGDSGALELVGKIVVLNKVAVLGSTELCY
jgi:hypothetical protein